MAAGDQGRAEAARRFPKAGTLPGQGMSSLAQYAPPGDRATREWSMEALMEHPGLRGLAMADHLIHGNRTVMRAIGELNAAVNQLEQED